ncbi:hypothetical protein [Fluviicola sp.]|uniref:hypothetical protein n=1 Tax=Fluviicola sp. TaxID=1917219 RepID=UPI0031CF41DE
MCLFRFFKQPKPENLSKEAYWKKYAFAELLKDLHQAVELLSILNSGHSHKFPSTEAFRYALEDAIDDIEFGNKVDLNHFYTWFAPTSDWDDFTGQDGEELGNRIYERVSQWKERQTE